MINHVVLIGRLTRDPELRYTSNGTAVTSFRLAVNRRFTNQQGEREADFINIVTWRQLAELCANYLKKGQQAGVDGRLQTRSYENREGRTVFVTEVVGENVQFLSPPQSSGSGGDQRTGNAYSDNQDPYGKDPFSDSSETIDISDDDLPF